MVSITDSQKSPSVSYHWHAETAVFHVDQDCLIDSLYFLVSFYLPRLQFYTRSTSSEGQGPQGPFRSAFKQCLV